MVDRRRLELLMLTDPWIAERDVPGLSNFLDALPSRFGGEARRALAAAAAAAACWALVFPEAVR